MTGLAFTGAPGVGKSTLCAALSANYGVAHVSVSSWLRDELTARRQDVTPSSLQQLGAQMATNPTQLVQRVLHHHAVRPGEHYVFDAVRHRQVLEALRRRMGFVTHVGLYLDRATQLTRLTERDGNTTATERAAHSTEEQLEGLMTSSDVVLLTGWPVDDLARHVWTVLLDAPTAVQDHSR